MARIAVIGAGVVGLTCAYELARTGSKIVVFDTVGPGTGASLGNGGWIVPTLSAPIPGPGLWRKALCGLLNPDAPVIVKPWAEAGLTRWLWELGRHCNHQAHTAGLEALADLNGRTLALFDALEADGIKSEMQCDGLLFAFRTERSLHHMRRELGVMERFGHGPVGVLNGASIRELEPALDRAVIGGFLVEQERHVRPELLTAGLAARLEQLGVEIISGCDVRGFERNGTRITAIRTSQGPITADQFLLAAGIRSSVLAREAGFRLPLHGGKGYSITLRHPKIQLKHPLYLGDTRVGCTPFDGALRVVGMLELSRSNDRLVPPRRIEVIKRAVDGFLVADWRVGADETIWAGMRPMTPDGLPAIGRAPGLDNLCVATGHGMLGVTLAPATAVEIAALISGREPTVDLRPFDPARFDRGHATVARRRSRAWRPTDDNAANASDVRLPEDVRPRVRN